MKTAKIALSILGVTLATLSFGQLLSQHENNKATDLAMARILEAQDEVLFYTAVYNEDKSLTMHWVNHKPNANTSYPAYITPLESRTYFARKVDAMYEEIPVVEAWMTTPFESSLEDSELRIEDWMTTPFDIEISDEALTIEPWMTSEWI
jgi:hypothetical protein